MNGQAASVPDDVVSFEDVLAIAFPKPPAEDTVFTVTYENAESRPSQGDLFPGASVKVKRHGTVFHVFPTGKS